MAEAQNVARGGESSSAVRRAESGKNSCGSARECRGCPREASEPSAARRRQVKKNVQPVCPACPPSREGERHGAVCAVKFRKVVQREAQHVEVWEEVVVSASAVEAA